MLDPEVGRGYACHSNMAVNIPMCAGMPKNQGTVTSSSSFFPFQATAQYNKPS